MKTQRGRNASVCVNVCVHGYVFERKRQMDISGKERRKRNFSYKTKNSKTWIKKIWQDLLVFNG